MENLKRLKLAIPYDIQINNINKNKKLLDFLKIYNLRSHYDISNIFFIEFFKYIFKNPNIYILTHNNKIINDFIIKIQEDIYNCIPEIKYRNKLKNVNINIGGKLYGLNDDQCFVGSPLRILI